MVPSQLTAFVGARQKLSSMYRDEPEEQKVCIGQLSQWQHVEVGCRHFHDGRPYSIISPDSGDGDGRKMGV